QLRALPHREYATVQDVWEGLGGKREESSGHVPRGPEPGGAPLPTPEPAVALTGRFGFRFDHWYRLAALPFGVSPATASVAVDDDPHDGRVLVARFGPWRVRTPVTNVAGTTVTGPYATILTIGPPHVSLLDLG